jgi:hypothetical protein
VKRPWLLLVLSAVFVFWPLVPSRKWSLVPYVLCGWLHSTEDQWQSPFHVLLRWLVAPSLAQQLSPGYREA